MCGALRVSDWPYKTLALHGSFHAELRTTSAKLLTPEQRGRKKPAPGYGSKKTKETASSTCMQSSGGNSFGGVPKGNLCLPPSNGRKFGRFVTSITWK